MGFLAPSKAPASPHPLRLCASKTAIAGCHASSAKQYSLNARKSPLKMSSNSRLRAFWSGRLDFGSQNAQNTSSRKTYPSEYKSSRKRKSDTDKGVVAPALEALLFSFPTEQLRIGEESERTGKGLGLRCRVSVKPSLVPVSFHAGR